jgi:hypothetical protein
MEAARVEEEIMVDVEEFGRREEQGGIWGKGKHLSDLHKWHRICNKKLLWD